MNLQFNTYTGVEGMSVASLLNIGAIEEFFFKQKIVKKRQAIRIVIMPSKIPNSISSVFTLSLQC